MKILSAKQLYEADRLTEERQNISSLDLMERAGTQIFNWLRGKMQGAQVPIHIFCGIGNNGGDGLVIGRLLIEDGYNVTMYVANFTDKRSKCFLINYDRVKQITKNWPILMTSEDDFPQIHPDDIIIDALFGIGLNRAPEGWVKSLIQYINASQAFTLSIDIPSGMSANSPVLDDQAVVHANHTLAFQTPKLSFFLPDTGKFAPFFEALDIGLDRQYLMETEPLAQLITKVEARQFYKPRRKYDHKGTYGHTLVVGGGKGKMGAVTLAASSCFRSGAGLVTVFCPSRGEQIVQTSIPEAMVETDADENLLTNINSSVAPSAVAVGMGIGTDDKTISALAGFLKKMEMPVVIDADAINCISMDKELLKDIPKHSVLTPHPGELERLIGKWSNDYEKIEKAQDLIKKHDLIMVIKGAHTLTLIEDRIYINTSGNPGMATAGSGDVLSGMIAGLMSQGYDPLIASVFGVFLHGLSGVIASNSFGYEAVIASDIVNAIGPAYVDILTPEPPPPEQ